jgi:catechol 2,3-dioxygenase-like lactoylglutathione lyase family enzyme
MGRVRRVQHVSVGIEAGREMEARAFYIEAIGLTEKPRPLGLKDNPVIWFDAGDDEHEVHLMATTGYRAPEGNHLCLEVDDLEALRAHLAQQGIPAQEVPAIDQRPRFVVIDPFGNGIELTQITGRFTPVGD